MTEFHIEVLLTDMAQIYQQKALESCDTTDLAHAKRYREAAEEIATLRRKLQAAEVCYKDALERLQGARNAALEEAAKACELFAADTDQPFKPHEDNYKDGWLDASNECTWAIRELKEQQK